VGALSSSASLPFVSCLADRGGRRPRYRIKSKTENVERVVTENDDSRLD